jgi:hypothetical protein
MSIVYGEYCLSGSSPHPFQVTARRMLELDPVARVAELLLWDHAGEVERTAFVEGSQAGDMDGIGDIDPQQVHKFHCVLAPCIAGVMTTIHVWACRDNDETIIDGQVFVHELLEHTRSPEDALRGLAELLARMAEHLDTTILHIADEDDDALLVPDSHIRLPSICGVYQRQTIEPIVEPLRERGAIIEAAPDPDLLVVWVAPIESLLQDASPRVAVLGLLRAHLMTTWQ